VASTVETVSIECNNAFSCFNANFYFEGASSSSLSMICNAENSTTASCGRTTVGCNIKGGGSECLNPITCGKNNDCDVSLICFILFYFSCA